MTDITFFVSGDADNGKCPFTKFYEWNYEYEYFKISPNCFVPSRAQKLPLNRLTSNKIH